MNRSRWIHLPLATLAAAALMTACSETPLAPKTESAVHVANNIEVIDNFQWFKTDSLEGDFVVKPNDDFMLMIGGHTVYFPANSICTLNSSYGPTEWDQPCKVTGKPINVHAKVMYDITGRPRIDFQPKLRFVPGKPATLTIHDPVHAALQSDVWYCPDGASLATDLLRDPDKRKCVNEGSSDSELQTQHDTFKGNLIRKVKHFSGYEVAAT